VREQTLAKVFFDLNSVFVDRNCLAWDKGALVSGLLEGHRVCLVDRNHGQHG
jgi:hypothetical protein